MELPSLPALLVEPVVRAALAEDLGRAGDITSAAVIPAEARMSGLIAARQPGTVAGTDAAVLAFRLMSPAITATVINPDGSAVQPGDTVIRIDGPARPILAAERVALNLLCRLSGVATATATLVAAARPHKARIACTRKTTPGLRALEKHAVLCGGGLNHRFGLDDAILIKDNHVAVCGGVGEAVRRAKAAAGHLMKIEVEVDGLDQLDQALSERPDVILLDNFTLPMLREAVARTAGRVTLEASGGVNLETVRDIAETGVDVISVGALTHSAASLDIGLDAIAN